MSLPHIAALTNAIIFLLIAGFQLLLAIGKPYGQLAWGGQHRILPKQLRVSSGIAVFIWSFVALVFLERSAIIDLGLGHTAFEVVLWILTPFMALGTVMNALSRSKKERNLWTPVNAIAFLFSLYLLLEL